MVKIQLSALPNEIVQLIMHPDPLIGTDIRIEDENGGLIAAIIPADAYQFFLKEIEKREDEIDSKAAQNKILSDEISIFG
ncbi:MAG: hypothetical protein RL748_4306 [Pseudomonadota bacterium]